MANDSKHKQFEEAKKLLYKGVNGDKKAVKSARRIRCIESGRYLNAGEVFPPDALSATLSKAGRNRRRKKKLVISDTRRRKVDIRTRSSRYYLRGNRIFGRG